VWGSKENTTSRYGKGFHWVESPTVMNAINKKISGDSKKNWLTYVTEKYLRIACGTYVGLSLGCGTGILERELQQRGIFRKLDGYDVTDEAINQAKKLAKEKNLKINYQVANLNRIKLEKNTYDIIFANSILHHLKNLEYVIDQIDTALARNGLLIVNEYIGPSQFQYTVKQITLINELLNILAENYKKRVTDPNSLKPFFIPPSKEFMDASDPSEAIRSSEIINLLQKKFEVVERKDFGGTILHMLLQDIAGNFDPNDSRDITVLKLLIYFEDYLIKAKILTSDFSFLVLRKKSKSFSNIPRFFPILKKVMSLRSS
jgi:2-polyprenyl-3-methyl-5-hydroxy-6-metoxy-1,4-benzoquinol methylase